MFGPILLALLIVPLIELYVIIQVGEQIGVLPTILTLIAISVIGTWLLKREGSATWTRLQAALGRGEMPANEVVDGALILFGGALLLTPGFVTDIVGLLLILPPTRAALKGSARRFLGGWAARRMGRAGTAGRITYETRVTGERSSRPTPTAPSLQHPDDEDGSPDTG
ncbi:MAG TPA: FxsA family protein [Actinomycetota bacterium]|nr:FxsA family protein [Actinomycetota bacterium]